MSLFQQHHLSRLDKIACYKFEKLDNSGKVISTFEQPLDSLRKLRLVALLRPEIIWTLVNLDANCPNLVARMLWEMHENYNKWENSKES